MTITSRYTHIFLTFICLLFTILMPISVNAAKDADKFVVVLDAGHGGKDIGATDNNATEKNINLAVALKVGELCKKKLKNTKVVFTRDDDTFVSLQGRADIANREKADLFISIHTNSVDAKNKNRRTVAGATVYTQGPHKDDANQGVARRENSVIELENGYEQKYSGFDPNKDESYIIFEMAQKRNLSESNRFAKSVQENLVKIAGRKDRGVHQAGFWVLWSTSMPSVLVELDFICNPESAKFMTSEEGVNKLAEAIFKSIQVYEQNWMQNQRMLEAANRKQVKKSSSEEVAQNKEGNSNADKNKSSINKVETSKSNAAKAEGIEPAISADPESENPVGDTIAIASAASEADKDLSHSNIAIVKEQKRAKTSADGRRRRSGKSKLISDERNLAVNNIVVKKETFGETAEVAPIAAEKKNEPEIATVNSKDSKKKSKKDKDSKKIAKQDTDKPKAEKSKREWVSEMNEKARKAEGHAGTRRSIKSKSEKN